MTFFLFLEDIGNGDKNAGFLDIAELVVYGSAENLHCRRESHIGVDQWGDVDALLPYGGIENLIIFLEIVAGEHAVVFLLGETDLNGGYGAHKFVGIGKMLFEEIEKDIPTLAGIGWIHCELSKEISDLGIDNGKGSKAIPKVVESEDGFRSNP